MYVCSYMYTIYQAYVTVLMWILFLEYGLALRLALRPHPVLSMVCDQCL